MHLLARSEVVDPRFFICGLWQTPLNRPAPNLTFSELEMHYPDTLRAALWVILAVMIVWSVASTVLVGLAQRFTITGRNDVYSGQSAPLAKPMRSRAVSPARSAELYFFLLLLGAVVVTGIDARTAQALDAKAINDGSPGHAWHGKLKTRFQNEAMQVGARSATAPSKFRPVICGLQGITNK